MKRNPDFRSRSKKRQEKLPKDIEYLYYKFPLQKEKIDELYYEALEETLTELNIELLIDAPYGYAFGVLRYKYDKKLYEACGRKKN